MKLAHGIAALGLAAAGPAAAHHSFAMFDSNKVITIEGAVKTFEWSNPHAEVVVMGGPAGTAPKLWSLELTSPSNLLRMGWSKRALKPGDRVTVELNPLRSGEAGGALRKATLADGQVFSTRLLAGGRADPPKEP